MKTFEGTRLGPYEIVSLVGAGGMGQVYRARDTRLGRDVAVKLLNPALAADASAVARFEREARAVAALNHPNILALHDIGSENSTAYVVTELLDGSSLRERLTEGPLPLRKVIDYGVQIATALAAAHERGIVHRDIKPDNIFVSSDGRVKVLDFGLASIAAPSAADSDDANTMAKSVDSSRGLLVGTAGYISPEQIRGRAADSRSDIFALGAVLYEMLSGRRAFFGETFADSMHAILHDDPPPIGGNVPPYFERVVRRCLEKEPGERFQAARDLAFALQNESVATGPIAAPQVRTRWPRALVATALLALAAAAGWLAHALWKPVEKPESTPVARFGIFANMTWSDSASISPDGKYVAYTGGGEPGAQAGAGRLWLRRLDSLETVNLMATEAVPPFFWSTDSMRLGYRVGNALSVRDVAGGSSRLIAEFDSQPQGVAWGSDGSLLVALPRGLYQVQPNGAPKLLLKSDPKDEMWRGSPSFLPDGKRFLYTVLKSGGAEHALETRVASLEGRELGTIGTGMISPQYADGALIFGSGGALYGQRFDPDKLTLIGDRVQLADSAGQDWRTGRLLAAASANGVLVYRQPPRGDSQFAIVDRTGHRIRNIGSPDSFTNFSVSADEQRIITTRRDPASGRARLVLIDVARGVTSTASEPADRDDAEDPTWMPDGRRIAFMHGPRIVIRSANGGAEQTVVDNEAYPDGFSRDGRFLFYGAPRGNNYEQWAIDITERGAKPIPLITGVTLADEGRLSPNGKWVVAHSNANGPAQIVVVPFPPTGESWQVSRNGGVQPRWSADGNELFYLAPNGQLMVVRMPDSDPHAASAPDPLFDTGLVPSDALDQFAPLRNGFLIRQAVVGGGDAVAVQVVVNWKSLIK